MSAYKRLGLRCTERLMIATHGVAAWCVLHDTVSEVSEMLLMCAEMALGTSWMMSSSYSGRPWLRPGLLAGLGLWTAWARPALLESQSHAKPGQSRGLQAKPGHAHH